MPQNQQNENHWMLMVILLREIAHEKKISVKEIAEKIGIEQSTLSRFFATKYKPNLDLFLKVAQAIGVNFFFEDKESKTDLNKCFEQAMIELGRRVEFLNKN